MTPKTARQRNGDAVVQRFLDSLNDWENPFERRPMPTIRSARTRSAVPTVGVDSEALEEDLVIQRFNEGRESWERPFAKHSYSRSRSP